MTHDHHVDATSDLLWTAPSPIGPPVGNGPIDGAPSPTASHPCGILWIPVGQPHPR